MPERNVSPLPATSDYEAKISYEAAQVVRHSKRAGFPQPFGDPLSGVVLVAETAAVSARVVDALCRSLAAVKLDRAYVTWPSPDLLQEILSLDPTALATVGPAAAHAVDASRYPLAKMSFSEAPEGTWFAWTEATSGLRLPALAPALDNADAKRRFWRSFLALRALTTPHKEPGLRP